jgi:EAL domain-containing protein (putative c-di-GMP-specific phosphodiesterase class I)
MLFSRSTYHPTQLHDGLLGVRILSILGESGLSPTRLEIEITESAIFHDLVAAERILNDLSSTLHIMRRGCGGFDGV